MNKTRKLTLSAMFLALATIIPQTIHTIPNGGNVLLPMHIPVLLCGFLCGPLYGLLVGILSPILSHLIFSMPATIMLGQMIIELGMYGLLTGILNNAIKIKKDILRIYIVLISSMIIGRIIYGICNALIFKVGTYSLSIWISAAFITATPGIIIQLILIPFILKMINKI